MRLVAWPSWKMAGRSCHACSSSLASATLPAHAGASIGGRKCVFVTGVAGLLKGDYTAEFVARSLDALGRR